MAVSVGAAAVLVAAVEAIVILVLLVGLRTAKLLNESLMDQIGQLDQENELLDAELEDEFETTGWNGRTRPRFKLFD